jgi:cytochrome c peroxidase
VPKYAFTDRKKVSEGVFGRKTERNSPSLFNANKLKTVMYDAHLSTLEMQVIVPIQEHVEMDMKMIDLIKKIKKIEQYNALAIKAFDREFDAFVLTRSIAAYERTLLSENSRFDRYYSKKNNKALTKNEVAGWKLFSEKLYCAKCHPAPDFTTFSPENNGLYKEYSGDKGRFRINLDSTQIGYFKIPSLRNIAVTYPYMHDGSLKSLTEVIDQYSRGGAGHSLQSKNIQPFKLTKQEKYQLIVFLNSLTDLSYLKNNTKHTK